MAGIQKITIDQQIAELGIRNTPAKMHISMPKMQMKIRTETPKMQIDRRAPTFKVNRRKLNSEMGLSSPLEFAKSFRDKGKSGALRGAKTAVNDGNFLGNMRIRGDRVGKLARNKTMGAILRKQQANIGLMPQNRPEVIWDKGYMSINWSKHSIMIDWDGEYMPQLRIDPKHSVEIYLRTEPHFRIRVEDVLDPNRLGRFVDSAI